MKSKRKIFKLFLFLSMFIFTININNAESKEIINDEYTSLDELIKSALNNNRYLLINNYNKSIGEANLTQASLSPNPEFSMDFNNNWLIDRSGRYRLELKYTHPLELFNKRDSIYQVSEIQLENIINDINYQKQVFILDLKSEYINNLINNENLNLSTKIFNHSKKMLELTVNRFKTGDIPKYELNIIKNEVLKLEVEIINLKNSLLNSDEKIKFLTGLNYIKIKPDNHILIKNIKSEKLYNAALLNRYDIKNLEINDNLYKAQINSFKLQVIPNLRLTGGLENEREDNGFNNSILIGLASDIPFFNRNQGLISQYEVLKEQNKSKLEFLKSQIKNNLEININTINSLNKTINLYKEQIIPTHLENVEILKKAYEIGDKKPYRLYK